MAHEKACRVACGSCTWYGVVTSEGQAQENGEEGSCRGRQGPDPDKPCMPSCDTRGTLQGSDLIRLVCRKPLSYSVADAMKEGGSKLGELGGGDCSDPVKVTFQN